MNGYHPGSNPGMKRERKKEMLGLLFIGLCVYLGWLRAEKNRGKLLLPLVLSAAALLVFFYFFILFLKSLREH